jgi:hypothetical protein
LGLFWFKKSHVLIQIKPTGLKWFLDNPLSKLCSTSLSLFDRHINKNLVLGNRWSKLDWNGLWVIIFQNCVLQPCPSIKMVAITKNRQGGHDCMVVGFTTNCNYFLSPLKLWVRIPLIARCTWYNIMWLSLSVTYSMLVVFSGFLHH